MHALRLALAFIALSTAACSDAASSEELDDPDQAIGGHFDSTVSPAARPKQKRPSLIISDGTDI